MSDAILRALFRLFLSRRRLLQWVTEAQTRAAVRIRGSGAVARMAGAVVIAAACAVAVGFARPSTLPLAGGLVILWAASPWIAGFVSRPPRELRARGLTPDTVQVLRSSARRTWRFFETFVGPEDSFLPPDNFQEDPQGVVAHRTSPTNIGLYLLAVLAARDFRWCGLRARSERLRAP